MHGCSDKHLEAKAFSPTEVYLENVYGYWESNDPANYSYEFFPSTILPPYNTEARFGRRFKGGVVEKYFNWYPKEDGNISIILYPCVASVFSLCDSVASAYLAPKGPIEDGNWTVLLDENLDFSMEKSEVDKYHRKNINVAGLLKGEFFLRAQEYYDHSIRGEVVNGRISIRMICFDSPITLYGDLGENNFFIKFNANKNDAVDDVMLLEGKSFTVTKWYENVSLVSSKDGSYVLSWEEHTDLKVSKNIKEIISAIGFTEKIERRSAVVNVVNEFIIPPKIVAGNKFFSVINVGFDKKLVLGGAGSEIVFTSPTEGTISHANIRDNRLSETRKFTWRILDSTLFLDVPDYGTININFISRINSGYSALIATPGKLGVDYYIQDWLEDGSIAIGDNDFPGHFLISSMFLNVDRKLNFNKDGTLTGDFNGFWFRDSGGDIVSYECIDALDNNITDYSTCFGSFDNFSKFKFAHLRQLHFISKFDNAYQAKYDAVIRGTGDGFSFQEMTSVSQTYRLTRVGD